MALAHLTRVCNTYIARRMSVVQDGKETIMASSCTCDVCAKDTGAITTTHHDNGNAYGYEAGKQRDREWEARRDADTARRVAALRAAGIAQCTDHRGEPTGYPLPSGTGEPLDVREPVAHVEYADAEQPMPIEARRYVAQARRYGVERRRRAAIMAQARRRRTMALNAARAARTVDRVAPLVEVTVNERKWHRKLTRLDDSGRQHMLVFWSHSRELAPRPLDALYAVEEYVMQRDRDHAAWALLASSEPNRDGRGTVDHMPQAVNGTEVRANERWHSTPRVAIMTVVERRNGIACVAPVDWSPYRVGVDGSRTPLVSTTTAKRRKRKTTTTAQARRAKLAAIAGTLGVDAQG